jgi:hypothetical protein
VIAATHCSIHCTNANLHLSQHDTRQPKNGDLSLATSTACWIDMQLGTILFLVIGGFGDGSAVHFSYRPSLATGYSPDQFTNPEFEVGLA